MEAIAARLLALADPTRIALLEGLRAGETSVQQLADLLEIERRNTSHHLATLHRAGILGRRREGTSVLYSIEDWSAPWLIDRAAESVASAS